MILTIQSIKDAVCLSYGVPEGALVTSSRFRSYAYPRFAAFKLARDHTGLSLPQIGRAFGNRDHTTIKHGLQKAEILFEKDPEFGTRYNRALHMASGNAEVPKSDTVWADLVRTFQRLARLKGFSVSLEKINPVKEAADAST
jgi:hypothetical protein